MAKITNAYPIWQYYSLKYISCLTDLSVDSNLFALLYSTDCHRFRLTKQGDYWVDFDHF